MIILYYLNRSKLRGTVGMRWRAALRRVVGQPCCILAWGDVLGRSAMLELPSLQLALVHARPSLREDFPRTALLERC